MKKDKKNQKYRPNNHATASDELLGSVHQVTIEKIVPQGFGMVRIGGQVIFIPGVLPGEIVRIALGTNRGGYRNASVVEIVQASDYRISPACPLFGHCGGCDAQYAESAYQLELKKSILMDTLKRQGGLDLPAESLSLECFSGKAWDYRNRWQFHPVRLDSGPGIRPGLMRRDSQEPIALDDCPVAAVEIRQWLATRPNFQALAGTVDELSDNPGRGPLMPVFGAQDTLFPADKPCKIQLNGRSVQFSGNGFFQSNLEMLERLLAWLTERIPAANLAWDLYCGCGVFSQVLESHSARITAVDNQAENCHFAKMNVDAAKTQVVQADVETWLEAPSQVTPDFVVLDPPRAGLSRRVLDWICAKRPPAIAYISCNPVTFSRDLRVLREHGYQVRELALFDFYPQTWHLETACLL